MSNKYLSILKSKNIELKKGETKLKELNVRLTDLNATKDKFFSIIAHDLKGPFNSILGLSEIIKEKVQENDLSMLESYAQNIKNASIQTYKLLENLLEWANSQMGYTKFNQEQLNLLDMFDEQLHMFKDLTASKGLSINNELRENLYAVADKNMLRTILRNLISNSIKFTNKGGEIYLNGIETGKFLEISVKDNGIGMNEIDQGKLFRLDEHFSNPGIENEKGTGLGLILCKDFVTKHGGEIWVESELGVGSEFKFTIPAQSKGEDGK